jgi:hypothetical protein
MIELLDLKHYAYFGDDRLPDKTVEVEYIEIPHWNPEGRNPDGSKERRFEVYVDHALVGTIEHSTESTDRHAGMIRIPGKGRKAWGWHATSGASNRPGLYERTKRNAVAKLVGYSEGRPHVTND